MNSSLIERLHGGSPLLGTMLTTSSPEIAEFLAIAGFDWLFLDLEHSAMQPRDAQRAIQAIATRSFAVIRVAENSPTHIKQALETGCDGIIIPLVNSASDVKRAVSATKYPPLGERSIGIGRAQGYGLHFDQYLRQANQRIALIIQIEHIDGVRNLHEIVQVPGIDGVLVGPYDLSGSMGLLGQLMHPEVIAAESEVVDSCLKAKIPIGVYCRTAEQARRQVAKGARFILIGSELMHMADAVKAVLGVLR